MRKCKSCFFNKYDVHRRHCVPCDFGGHKICLLYHIYQNKCMKYTKTFTYCIQVTDLYLFVITFVFELKYVIKYPDFMLKSSCIMTYIDNSWFYKPNTHCIFLKRSNTWSFRILNHFVLYGIEHLLTGTFFTYITTWVMDNICVCINLYVCMNVYDRTYIHVKYFWWYLSCRPCSPVLFREFDEKLFVWERTVEWSESQRDTDKFPLLTRWLS